MARSTFGAQIQINGAWTDVPVLTSTTARITGGLQKDAAVGDPTRCQLTLRNDKGWLSSRNPRSPYFGYLGRATRARAIVPDPTHMWITTAGDLARTPDHASLDIVGDLDVRIDLQPLTWDDDLGVSLGGKYVSASDQRSWTWWVEDRTLFFRWSPDGTIGTSIVASSTAQFVPAGDNRIALRATLDVDNGGGGWTCTFYTADTIGGTWTQLGAPVSAAGVTSIFSSTASLRVGRTEFSLDNGTGKYHGFQMRSGIGGTVVASPDFTAQTAGSTSFNDAQGRTWTMIQAAAIRDFDIRASGEVADWPVRWTTSGRHRTASVELAGWLRRLNEPSEPLRSPLYREATSAANTAAMTLYVPGEDGSEATTLASGIGGSAMTFTGEPNLAASDRFPGSDPLLEMVAGVTLTARPKPHTATGVIACRVVADVPATGWAADAIIREVRTTGGSVTRWVLEISGGGALRIRGLASDGTEISNGGYIGFDVWGRRQMIGWQLTQVSNDVYWQIFTRRIADDLTVSEVGFDGTFTTRAVGKAVQLRGAPGGNIDGGALGHWMLGTSASLATGIDRAIVGNNGEAAAVRLARLGLELGIPIRIIGRASETEKMGPQTSGDRLAAFTACAAVDGGRLAEARDEMMLEYRTWQTLLNQRAKATFAYGTAGEGPQLEPVEPTADVVNVFEAKRSKGSSYQATVDTGRMSTQEHPAGVGPRPGGETYDCETDSQLPGFAGWATHLGTWDDYRYPVVRVNLARLVDVGKAPLARAVAAARPGDRIVVEDPPEDCPPDPVDMQVLGWTEEIQTSTSGPRRTVSFNTAPNGPWMVGVAGIDLVDSDGTTLVSGLSAVTPGTSQAVSVNVVGTLWPSDAHVPFVMWLLHPTGAKAERVTITAISGTSTPQTFTLTRGLDGYTIPHDAGAALILFQPLRWSRG